jgi:hypothetical protein
MHSTLRDLTTVTNDLVVLSKTVFAVTVGGCVAYIHRCTVCSSCPIGVLPHHTKGYLETRVVRSVDTR